MKNLDTKLNEHFGGKVVRKDLTKLVKGNAIVPIYVLEYLLGQYCATSDEATILQGVETVKNIIAKHFVHRDEAQVIKSIIREKGSHRIIDKVSVNLNDKKDQYEASFSNLGLNKVPIADSVIKEHQKLLYGDVWCILTLGYFHSDERDSTPWIIENIKPIQVSNADLDEFKEARKQFTKDEWIDILIQTIGLNPKEFTLRSKLLQLSRLIPYVENNYNLMELGPKGTGKSHLYTEFSPHGILVSGGEASKASLFVNMSSGKIGMVGYWDVVAYDEFAGKTKKTDRALVDILKNYMANKSFSRGTDVHGASASMVFVGNTDHSVRHMMKHSDLFDTLPKDYRDSALLDRIHSFLPGWEIQKLRNEMYTSDYGFIVDYLAGVLKELRKEDRTNEIGRYFELSKSMTTRDMTGIMKTYAGLAKVIFPHGDLSEDETKELLDFAIECRKRVKTEIMKLDETYEEVDFSYINKRNGESTTIETLEVIEYGTPKIISEIKNTSTPIANTEVKGAVEEFKLELISGQKLIRDNQSGISYGNLFGAYLIKASDIKLIDPYIRLPYQLRNFMEFARLLSEKKDPDIEVKLHLVTSNNEDYIEGAKEAFDQMTYSLESIGIIFSYEFDENIHDRSINMDNGWKILLGRGLDIWQKTGGWYDVNEYIQEKRLCKACEITFVAVTEN